MLVLADRSKSRPNQNVHGPLRPGVEASRVSSLLAPRIQRAKPTNQARPPAAKHHQAE